MGNACIGELHTGRALGGRVKIERYSQLPFHYFSLLTPERPTVRTASVQARKFISTQEESSRTEATFPSRHYLFVR